MGRKRDQFWEYVDDLNGRFKCKFCQNEFSGGVTRIKSHLSGIKGHDIEICSKAPHNIQTAAFEAIAPPCKKGKSINGDEGGRNSTSITQNIDKNAVDELFFRFMFKNDILIDGIESQEFVDFVKGVSEFGSGYQLPDFKLRCKSRLDYVEKTEQYIQDVERSWLATGYTLMFQVVEDTRRNGVDGGFLNALACCPRGAVCLNLQHILVGVDEFYDVDIEQMLLWTDSSHLLQVVVNNDWLLELSKGYFKANEHDGIYVTKCAIHGIESLLMVISTNVDWVQETIRKGKMIVSYIHKCGMKLACQIVKHTEYKRYKYPCLARLSSNFLLLHSIIGFETELRALQLLEPSLGRDRLDSHVQEMTKWVANVIGGQTFWSRGREVLYMVDALFQVLDLVNNDAPTSGYIYEAMCRAKDAIGQLCEKDEVKYGKIWKFFMEQFDAIIHPVHAAAALLNPANIFNDNFEEDSKMEWGIHFLAQFVVKRSHRDAFLNEVAAYRRKEPELFTAKDEKMLKTSHPGIWWDYCGRNLPTLRKYAVKILSQYCSVSCLIPEVEAVKGSSKLTMNKLLMNKFSLPRSQGSSFIEVDKLIGLPEYVNYQDLEDFPGLESVDEETMKSYTYADPIRIWLQI